MSLFDAGRYEDLAGKVAVVTGAAQGIGDGIATRLAAERMRVVLVDRNAFELAQTVDRLGDAGATVQGVVADLSSQADISNVFDEAMAAYETVDVLVNNAADLHRRRLLDEHDELMTIQFDTNIRGPYLCSQKAAGIMRDSGGGSIINISSVGALRAHHRGFPYDVTKGAVNAMTTAMAVDLGEYGIRVNGIGPGVTETWRSDPESEDYQWTAQQIPLRRHGTIADIGAMTAFLASDEASYVTGQVIYVDGGITSQLNPPGSLERH